MSRSPLFEGSLGALSTLSLAWTALKPQLTEDGLDFGGSTASVKAPGSLAALVRHRKMLVLGLLSFKRIYSMLYRAIGPMIIGRKARARRTRSVQTVDGATATATTAETPVTAADAPPPWDTNITDYADYDLNLNDGLSPPSAITGDATVTTGTVQITLVGAWRHFIETLMVPSIGHTTGTLLRHVCTTALAAQWVRDRRWSWASAMEKRVGRWDTFTWSLLGACSYFFVKVHARRVVHYALSFDSITICRSIHSLALFRTWRGWCTNGTGGSNARSCASRTIHDELDLSEKLQ